MSHSVALWAALAAAFGNLAVLATLDFVSEDFEAKAIGVVVSAIIVGGTVYSKERLNDAKRERDNEP